MCPNASLALPNTKIPVSSSGLHARVGVGVQSGAYSVDMRPAKVC
jgi:hypothetical protein